MAQARMIDRDFAGAADPAVTLRPVTLTVENMHCGGCMSKVERALMASPGVAAARANLAAKRVAVSFDENRTAPEALIGALAAAGFTAAELVAQQTGEDDRRNRDFLARLAVAGFAAMNVMLLSVSVWSGHASGMDPATRDLLHWVSALIALPAVAYSGQPFFRSAWQGIKVLRLNMDVPISLAILLSAGMSLVLTARGGEHVYFDACVSLLFFLLIGRYLDQRMRVKARGAAQNLLKMRAKWATIIQPDGSAERIAAAALLPGMRVAVAAGERFPADGIVSEGRSDADESLLTGESAPRAIAPGAEVFAGTVNLGAPITFEAGKTEGDTLLAELTRLMETAEQGRGRYVRLADRASRLYSPAVHLIAGTTFLGWMIAGAGWESALMIAIAVLIITCPCALALAVPAVQVAASDRLFAAGVLVKAADGLERLSEIDTVVFDKTGTLTLGHPVLLDVRGIDDATLKAAASLAAASRHPYAVAVADAAKARFGAVPLAADIVEEPGFGLRAMLPGGEARLGSAEWCGADGKARPASLYYAAPGERPIAFGFADTLRPDAAAVIAEFALAGFRVEIMSGDRAEAVEPVARALGIAIWRAGCKPQEKIARLSELAAAGRKVLMVGDGLNDAPALASAHASLAPSSAADISQTASDAVFQGAALRPVIELLATARRAQRMAFENFAVAGLYNLVFVPIAAAGFVTPLIAAIAMSTSSIVVTANAVRLRGMKLRLSA
ncbi:MULTISPECIES: heavy metal translocating P-type ATPase [Rhodomicrobium]|uniref:heavy metal translocating P-type ATPase n=1 Tax=Rhodomicrobium TaxID=1068 RepID=UPI001FD8DA49|nr:MULTISPECIES: heavy metal translocating P-type ATPase [Rhodomicrobium]